MTTSTLTIEPFLRALVECGGSDLHCKVGSPPRVRIDGRLRKLQTRDLAAADTEMMVREGLRRYKWHAPLSRRKRGPMSEARAITPAGAGAPDQALSVLLATDGSEHSLKAA